jgi:hypothetical protein
MRDNLPPRKYAEQVLGKAATVEQLDELFRLHAAAHPVVTHDVVDEIEIRGEWWHNLKRTTVEIYSSNPATFTGPAASTIAKGVTIKSPDDQWNKRRGVEVAFGRALRNLREEIEGPKRRQPPKAAELSTALMIERLAKHVEAAGEGVLGLAYRPGKGWLVQMEFGSEAPDSPMVGGAAYGIGEHLREAVLPAARDCRIIAKEVDDAPAA